MLEHLYLTYAKIVDRYIEENDKRMHANYNVNQPIEVLVEQIDEKVDIAATANNPYSVEQVVTAAYNLVFKTSMFVNDSKIWRCRNPANNTRPHLKVYFTVAHHELREL